MAKRRDRTREDLNSIRLLRLVRKFPASDRLAYHEKLSVPVVEDFVQASWSSIEIGRGMRVLSKCGETPVAPAGYSSLCVRFLAEMPAVHFELRLLPRSSASPAVMALIAEAASRSSSLVGRSVRRRA